VSHGPANGYLSSTNGNQTIRLTLLMQDDVQIRCFHEHDPNVPLRRRAFVEAVGSFLLVFVALASGVKAQLLAPSLPLVSLIANATATAGALVGLILALGPVSGGHFNPLITALQWLRGERNSRCTLGYCAAQLAGATFGVALANTLFTPSQPSAIAVTTPLARLLASEVLASAALMTIVFACSRSSLRSAGPMAVGAWLAAAIIATPSASLANPAIVVAGLLSTGSIAVTRANATFYMLAECTGALMASAVISIAYPPGGYRHAGQ
jgi:glycerol uptake facilitator-like aquaporin